MQRRQDHQGTLVMDSINGLTEPSIDAAIEVPRQIAAGLLESAYQAALGHEFQLRGVLFEEQGMCPLSYTNLKIEAAYPFGFLVKQNAVADLKTNDATLDVDERQPLSYRHCTQRRLDWLMNFRAMTSCAG